MGRMSNLFSCSVVFDSEQMSLGNSYPFEIN